MRGSRQNFQRSFRARGDLAKSTAKLPSGLPDVFVVGAGKSGTTAIYHYFKTHPQSFVPATVKETNFMAFCDGLPPMGGPGDHISAQWSATKIEDYRTLYADRTSERIAVDVSPNYLFYPQAADKIASLCPNAKIVIVLRNPIECVFSLYSMLRREGRETCPTFREAFYRSHERIAAGWQAAWDYENYFRFSEQVARYLSRFPQRNLFIRRYELLKTDPQRFYGELCKFLEIEEIDTRQANRVVNTGATKRDMIRKRLLGRMLLRTARVATLVSPRAWKTALSHRLLAPAFVLSAEDRQMLVDHFSPDILALQDLLDWDLGAWLQVEAAAPR